MKHTYHFPLSAGFLFLAFGIGIVIFPALLITLIASFFIAIGVGFLALAWQLYRAEKEWRVTSFTRWF